MIEYSSTLGVILSKTSMKMFSYDNMGQITLRGALFCCATSKIQDTINTI